MVSTTFRTPTSNAQPAQEAHREQPKSPPAATVDADVEVPFTSWKVAHKVPFTAEYFDVAKFYNEPGALFTEEAENINKYFEDKVTRGEIVDDAGAIRHRLKEIEKHIGIQKGERPVLRLSKVSAYINFLRDTDNIKLNSMKYGQ
ncbi:MAG TPA: hypothetical protein PKJ68_04550 [Candidatus Woesebacteria bacterium]|nr:hypothetical protein [Candidatus Woesebacteria bacterium]